MRRYSGFRRLSILVILTLLAVGAFSALAGAAWRPSRPINIVVPWNPGGATDLTTRVTAAQMERALGTRLVIVNSPGGAGAIGMQDAFNKPHDGYTWSANADASVVTYPVLGYSHLTHRDWLAYYSIFTPNVIAVGANSPIKTMDDLIQAMKDRPGEVTIGTAGLGSSGHTAAELFAKAAGVTYKHVAYSGGAPAVVATVSGEVEVVTQLSMEQVEMLRAKRLRALAVMSDEPLTVSGYGTIPPLKQFVPNAVPAGSYFGIFVPADLPADVVAAIDAAFDAATSSEALKQFAEEKGAVAVSLRGTEAAEVTEQVARRLNWLLYDAGLAKASPADFGIPRP